MSEQSGKTSPEVASKASDQLSNPQSTAPEKSVAASALVQTNPHDGTSQAVASQAGQQLQDPESTADQASVAGSVLSQTPSSDS